MIKAAGGGLVRVTDETFASRVLEADRPVMVDFWAPRGTVCGRLGTELEQVAEDLEDRASVVTLNVAENPATASHYGIASVPTLLLFKGGRVVAQVIGLAEKRQIAEKFGPQLA